VAVETDAVVYPRPLQALCQRRIEATDAAENVAPRSLT
jgi:hypothetical protein